MKPADIVVAHRVVGVDGIPNRVRRYARETSMRFMESDDDGWALDSESDGIDPDTAYTSFGRFIAREGLRDEMEVARRGDDVYLVRRDAK